MPSPLTLRQLCQRLRCSVVEVRALVRERRFPHAYLDSEGRWRVPAADINAYIRATT
jgi:excisionase family DNA binding protein